MSSPTMFSTQLGLAAVALCGLSGLAGFVIPSRYRAGDRVCAVLLGLATGCAGLAAQRTVSMGSGSSSSLSLPWTLLGSHPSVSVDGLSAFFLVPVMGLLFLASVYGVAYWPAHDHPRTAQRLRLALGLLGAGMGLAVIADHALSFLLGWEVMALAAFFAMTPDDQHEDVRRSGFIYLACTRASTLALLVAFLMLQSVTHSFAFLPLPPEADSGLVTAIFVLAFAGFALKAGAIPLHLWLPGAHANAPSHVSAVLSGVMLKVGIYGLIRISSLLPPLPVNHGGAVLLLGVGSAVFGVAFALGQHHLKRLLAYHSIENIGIILMGIGTAMIGRSLGRPELEVLGLGGALLHVWNHALFKGLLFLGAGSVQRATGTAELDELGGLAKRMPKTGLFFGIAALAICGLPPLNGFVSELLIFLALLNTILLDTGSAKLIAILAVPALALVGGLASACFLKVVGIVFLGEPRSSAAQGAKEAPFSMLWPMGLLALGCVVIGIVPQIVSPALDAALHSFDLQLGAESGTPLAAVAPFDVVGAVAIVVLGLGTVASTLFVLGARKNVPRVPTWDCGYAKPTVRMQYSASSFADGLTGLFGWALRTEKHGARLTGLFPLRTAFRTHVPDPVLDKLILPVSRRFARFAESLHWIQRGDVHIYVLYIAVAVVASLIATVWAEG